MSIKMENIRSDSDDRSLIRSVTTFKKDIIQTNNKLTLSGKFSDMDFKK